jgi:hypothetical protein
VMGDRITVFDHTFEVNHAFLQPTSGSDHTSCAGSV